MSKLAQSLVEQSRALAQIPSRIISGPPGSGKTKALLDDLSQNKDMNLLVLTHTRAAAENIKLKLGNDTRIWRNRIKNIHAACLSEIYTWRGSVYSKVYNKNRTVSIIRDVMAENRSDLAEIQPRKVADWISMIKNSLDKYSYFDPGDDKFTIEFIGDVNLIHQWNVENPIISEFAEDNYWPDDWSEVLITTLLAYQAKVRSRKALDYDDILLLSLKLFERGNPPKYEPTTVYVDDIADFNDMQCRILRNWLVGDCRYFITSDSTYQIYNFRFGGRWKLELDDIVSKINIEPLDSISYRSIPSIQRLSQDIAKLGINTQMQTGLKQINTTLYKTIERITNRITALEIIEYPKTSQSPVAILSSRDKANEAQLVCKIIKELVTYNTDNQDSSLIRYRNIAVCHYSQYHSLDLDRIANQMNVPLIRINVTDNDMDAEPDDDELLRIANSDTNLDQDKVRVMSLHTVKGLDVMVIFILGLEDPEYNTGLDSENLTYPLLHIGINRAEQFVILGWTRERNGKTYKTSNIIQELHEKINGKPWIPRDQHTTGRSGKPGISPKPRLSDPSRRYDGSTDLFRNHQTTQSTTSQTTSANSPTPKVRTTSSDRKRLAVIYNREERDKKLNENRRIVEIHINEQERKKRAEKQKSERIASDMAELEQYWKDTAAQLERKSQSEQWLAVKDIEIPEITSAVHLQKLRFKYYKNSNGTTGYVILHIEPDSYHYKVNLFDYRSIVQFSRQHLRSVLESSQILTGQHYRDPIFGDCKILGISKYKADEYSVIVLLGDGTITQWWDETVGR